MSINLLDVAKGYLTVSKAGSKDGAGEIFNMVSRPEFGGGLLNNLGDLFGGGETANKSMDLGGSLLNGLMGDKMGGAVDLISQATGMKSGSTSGLMKMLLPVMMSIIGKKVKSEGLGLDGLLGMLNGQKQHIEKAAPAGLMDNLLGTLGMGGLAGAATSAVSGLAKGAGDVTKKTADVAKDTANAAKNTAGAAAKATTDTVKKTPGMLSRILPLILLLGAIGLGFWLMKGCNGEGKGITDGIKEGAANIEKGAKDMGSAVVGGVESLAGDAMAIAGKAGMSLEDAIGDLTSRGVEIVDRGAEGITGLNAAVVGKAVKGFENLGAIMEKKLKDGTSIIIPEYGVENQLISYIESGKGSDSEAWFNFDRILFDTGSSALSAASMDQVKNIAAIMNAYPDVNLKIGGYTDNVGNPDSNLKLSDDRAKAVVAAVVAEGIDAGRLSGEGFGEAHPVDTNDTAEGRAKNRRIGVRVSE